MIGAILAAGHAVGHEYREDQHDEQDADTQPHLRQLCTDEHAGHDDEHDSRHRLALHVDDIAVKHLERYHRDQQRQEPCAFVHGLRVGQHEHAHRLCELSQHEQRRLDGADASQGLRNGGRAGVLDEVHAPDPRGPRSQRPQRDAYDDDGVLRPVAHLLRWLLRGPEQPGSDEVTEHAENAANQNHGFRRRGQSASSQKELPIQYGGHILQAVEHEEDEEQQAQDGVRPVERPGDEER